jgi:hypothetical protein
MARNSLTAHWVKQQYTFVLELDQPVSVSIAAVLKFLTERHMQIESMTVTSGDKEAFIMVLRSRLEKDRLKHTMNLLVLVRGVLKVELLQ